MGGVQQDRPLRLAQGGHRPVLVVMVPLEDVPQDGVQVGLLAPLPQLQQPALRPGLGGGGQKDLHVRPGQDHRADVPAVHDHVVLPGLPALKVQQEVPHLGDGGHLGGQTGDLMLPDGPGHVLPGQEHPLFPVGAVVHGDVQPLQQGDHLGRVGGVGPRPQGPEGHRAVDGPRIHIEIPQLAGQGPGQGALSGPGGAVNGDADVLHGRSLRYRF